MSSFIRNCSCGSSDVAVENCFGASLFVECGDCGARGKFFPIASMVGKVWPRDAAIKAWNAGEMDQDDGGINA